MAISFPVNDVMHKEELKICELTMNNELSVHIIQSKKEKHCWPFHPPAGLVLWLPGEGRGPDRAAAWDGAAAPGGLGVLGHLTEALESPESPGEMRVQH